ALLPVALSVAMLDSIITTSAVAQTPDVKKAPDVKQSPEARQTPDAQPVPPAQRGPGGPPAPTVHWIRVQSAEAKWHVARTFTDSRPVQRATLKLAADFCYATVAINGRDVLEVEPYVATQSLDVTAVLRRGENVVTVRVKTAPGPTAIALSLERRFADGSIDTVVTDQDWKAEAGGVLSDLGAVPDPLWGVGRRDATLSPDDNYDQWKQSLATPDGKRTPRFWTAPGFEVTTVRTAADDEGSWIALAFDDAGRATISREDRGLLRMTLDERRETVTRVERIDVPLEECRGLAYSDGWLFANANNSKALYRLKIDDDGRPQEMTKLREFAGGVGHGRNDLALSGDAVYSIHGDSVDAPSGDVGDWTSPLRESRSAKPGREGHLVRVDRTSGKCDIVAAGLRNPYGIALNRRGDRFTFDADNEFDMGAPWYRPTRILNLVDGADIGYREATGSWPPRFHDQPDNTPPVIDIGRSSPTAVMFGENLRFPTEYRRALFVLDWTYGRVLAVHLAERGASWRAATELFLQGRPLNVTDIAAGPDGAMYLITGGRKTQSGLFRVRWAGGVDRSLSAGTTRHDRDLVKNADAQRVRAEAFSAAARRRDAVSSEKSLATTFDALDDADPIVRHAARVAMESAPVAEWRLHVMSAPPSNTALVGLMALARARESAEVGTLLDRLLQYQPEKLTLGRRFVWLRVLTLAQQTN
ncbi:MAG TPA: hypothetical protein PLV92_02085, partial [Pirellulaceae bacterium]|nr:hypothetical protein [Pirellulaceae bacterium]